MIEDDLYKLAQDAIKRCEHALNLYGECLLEMRFMRRDLDKMPKLIEVAKASKRLMESYQGQSRPGFGGEESLIEALYELEKS